MTGLRAGTARADVRERGAVHLLLADKLPEQTVADLEARGHTCVLEPDLSADDLPGRIAGFDALVVRSTKVKAPVFESADRLALVIRAGAGTNTIDTDAAATRGVLVSNVPGRNSAAVAELTMGLLLAVDRRIADNVADLRSGRWDKKRYSKAGGLLGSTMGIIGLGSIGMAVAERAAAFGIQVQSVAREGRTEYVVARAEEAGVTWCGSLEELASSSDIVSLHVPSTAATRHLVDADFLARMKPGAILLNTSRGDVVDEAALLAALDAGAVRAGLDVYADEPGSGHGSWDSPLAKHPEVVGTHHIGASTEQAQRAIAAGVTEIIDAFVVGETRHCVNLDERTLGSFTLTIRHLDRVGVLAGVLDRLSSAHLNVEHMENRIFRGGEAAVATIDVGGKPSQELLDGLRALPHVLSVSEVTLGPETEASVPRRKFGAGH
ncbi:MAG TPA: phosphoglycerate dehydrogenase [Nocardioides sp.]|uniref:phosphoglycerate dehydrogenase n=1 Tax=uncultured Nocardioides sp. TaxID=198441 RepID=UPI002603749D|nr:phosphoglycerate dehydrogenase [uncultured Nocardioides sp.]HRD63282.1 phosphoglycerate dehydrogenase [Nocardioides sp.]HRI94281.1 phosphoglycerate dehydrogenase [Nocardioides sp.]HRK46104.1 phosphoglycerate dehydrogenase [Nocardioides sp.]